MAKQEGFTLIELLIVIGIIAILAAAVIVAINPGQQFEQARNSTRRSQLSSVASAIHSWAAMENNGVYPECLVPDTEGDGVDINSVSDCPDGDADDDDLETVLSDYINQLPTPPGDGEAYMAEVIDDGASIELWSDSDEWPTDEVIVQ